MEAEALPQTPLSKPRALSKNMAGFMARAREKSTGKREKMDGR